MRPHQARARPCKHSDVCTLSLSDSHCRACVHIPTRSMSPGQCHSCTGHTVSLTPTSHSHVRQVGGPGHLSSAGLRTDPITPPLQAPALLIEDTWHSLAHPQHPQNHALPEMPAPHPPTPSSTVDHPRTLPLPHTHHHLSRKPPKPTKHPGILFGFLLIAQRQLALIRRQENWNYAVLPRFKS